MSDSNFITTLPEKAGTQPHLATILASLLVLAPYGDELTKRNIRHTRLLIEDELAQMGIALATRLPVQNLPKLQEKRREELAWASILCDAAEAGFPHIFKSMDFLSLCQPKSVFPIFGFLTPYTTKCEISIQKTQSRWQGTQFKATFRPGLASDLQEQYSNTVHGLMGRFSETEFGICGISAEYAGLMPAKLEERVLECLRNPFFDDVTFYFEAPIWKINETVQVIEEPKDPLIVGTHTYPNGFKTRHLIGMFDPTLWEEYVVYKFVTGL